MSITKRVGQIVPSLNTVGEDDFRRALPADVGGHTTRVRLGTVNGRVTQEALLKAGEESVQLATLLADARIDAIGLNCTGASLSSGPDAARRLRDQMSEAANTPVTTTILSVIGALKHVGVRKILHVCPFTPEFATDESNFLRAEGYDVTSHGLNFTDARVAAKMTPEEIVDIAMGVDTSAVDGVFLACANVRALEAAPELSRRLGKPVVTSNQTLIWDLLKLVNHPHADDVLVGQLAAV